MDGMSTIRKCCPEKKLPRSQIQIFVKKDFAKDTRTDDVGIAAVAAGFAAIGIKRIGKVDPVALILLLLLMLAFPILFKTVLKVLMS